MAALGKKLRTIEGNRIAFWCPGCDEAHTLYIGPGGWTFNRDIERPTFRASVRVSCGHFSREHKKGDACWCTYNRDHPDDPSPFTCSLCHSYVTDGQIQFLEDCTHKLVSKTVPLPDWPI